MDRRSYLVAAGLTAVTTLAGCTEQLAGTDEDDGTDDTPTESGDGGEPDGGSDDTPAGSGDEQEPDDEGGDVEPEESFAAREPTDAIEAYVAAANEQSEQAIARAMHGESPLNPENLELGFGFEPFDEVDPDALSVVDTAEDATTEDVLELEQAAFWLEDDPAERLEEAELTIVTVETGHPEVDDELDRWVLALEDEHWRVFIVGTDELEEPELEAVLEEPIEDTENRVVADVEWDVEPFVDDFEPDGPLVDVALTESPGIEAETVRMETAIAGGNMELYADEDTDAILWAGSSGAIEFDPEGDQLEVIAVTDDGEEVVHREQYRP